MAKEPQESATGGEPAALLTYRDVARRLGVPLGTLHYWVCCRAIPHVRLGPRSVRFRPAELERWLDERVVRASGEARLHQGDADLAAMGSGTGAAAAAGTRPHRK